MKRSILVEAAGGPLAVVVAGANVRDDKLLAATLDAVVVERPKPTEEGAPQQHLCLDKGYDNEPSREVVKERDLRRAHPQDRRREARARHGREALPGEAVGGGADAGLAQ